MKTKNSIPARLLASETDNTTWTISVMLSKSDRITMTFTNKSMAEAEYTRLRSAGVCGGQWINAIEITQNS